VDVNPLVLARTGNADAKINKRSSIKVVAPSSIGMHQRINICRPMKKNWQNWCALVF
jgi:hypothetical protein